MLPLFLGKIVGDFLSLLAKPEHKQRLIETFI